MKKHQCFQEPNNSLTRDASLIKAPLALLPLYRLAQYGWMLDGKMEPFNFWLFQVLTPRGHLSMSQLLANKLTEKNLR